MPYELGFSLWAVVHSYSNLADVRERLTTLLGGSHGRCQRGSVM